MARAGRRRRLEWGLQPGTDEDRAVPGGDPGGRSHQDTSRRGSRPMGSRSARTPIFACRRRFGPCRARAAACAVVALALLATLPATRAAAADDGPSGLLHLSIQDPDGNFFPRGEVEFCLHGGGCLYAEIDRGHPGQFVVPRGKLVPDGLYQVIVYDPNVGIAYELRDWRYVAADFDAGWDPRLGVEKFTVFARFHGKPGGALAFAIARTLNPEWERRAGLATAGPDSLAGFPRLAGRLVVPLQLGGAYRDGPDAAGGVISIDGGLGAAVSWRGRYHGALPSPGAWRHYREFTVAWDANRYTTAQVMRPGTESDVWFHRLTLGYGMGRLSPVGDTQLGVSFVAGLGAVLDGTSTLRWLDREYRMFGAGVRLTACRQFTTGQGLRWGLCGVLEAVNWWATPVDGQDHWHGLAPVAAVGLMVY